MTRLDSSAETAIYRIVQEALTNIVKHVKAQRVSIILEPRSDRLQVIVEDDGVARYDGVDRLQPSVARLCPLLSGVMITRYRNALRR